MIDHRAIAILMELFGNQEISLYELSVQTGVEKEGLLSSMQQVNDLLVDNGFAEIDFQAGVYRVPESLRDNQSTIFDLLRSREVYLSQEERRVLIYLYTFIRKDFISNIHYQDLLNVSKNTTLTDIKNVRELCHQFDVAFHYTRSHGYHLVGREEDKHRLAFYAISDCLKSPVGIWALDYILRAWDEVAKRECIKQRSLQLCQFYQLSPLEDRLDEFLYFLQFLAIRRKRVEEEIEWQQALVPQPIQDVVSQLWKHLEQSSEGLPKLTANWTQYLAHRLQGCLEGQVLRGDQFFSDLTLSIVEEMERLSLISFERRQELIEGLQKHLIPAYYRLTARTFTINTYTEVIKEEHKDLFEIVKKALSPLEKVLGFTVPDSEVSYFVIHFGGYIEAAQERSFRYRALVVCPNGVSSSLIVKENLKQLFPNISFADAHSVAGFQQIQKSDYDMIFSTVKLETKMPFFLVPPLMNLSQKRELFHLVSQEFANAGYFPIEIEQLMTLIGKYATVHREQALKYELVQFLNEKSYERKERSPMLEELITKETYQYSREKMSWQEAIACAAKPLLQDGAIEESYIGAMVNKVLEFGPFIDLGKGVAIPHARPEDGVHRVGMSMLKLEEPVYLLDDSSHEIRLIICIAAVDNQTHLKALSHLTAILREPEKLQQLVESTDFDAIKDLLKEDTTC
ncbi:BglG family transcription antiterminator [Streptococcus gallolyticus]|nr:BglG family transcription antiterminator [Streptococcus gallolyticus]MBY5040879.1 BglG family transcription antiterminator [Streptococcus gallolyticus]